MSSSMATYLLRLGVVGVLTLTLSLTACGGVTTPVIPTMTPDLSLTPAAARIGLTPRSTPQTAASSLVLDDKGFADPAFRSLWERYDGDVASGKTTRSWYWGQPVPFGAVEEPYAESPGGKRLVQYFDKGRMEINDPAADPKQDWYVTSGLLTVELVSGRVQVGANSFEEHSPAGIPVVGDLDSPNSETPQYADYSKARLTAASNRIGQAVTTQFSHNGNDQEISAPATVKIVAFDDVLGHNIPDVFKNYFDQDLSAMGLNWIYVMGHPISEPYWVTASFGGSNRTVLVQLYERRALAYDPSGAAGQQVQFTNIGLHYYRWRYHDQSGQVPVRATGAVSTRVEDARRRGPARAAA